MCMVNVARYNETRLIRTVDFPLKSSGLKSFRINELLLRLIKKILHVSVPNSIHGGSQMMGDRSADNAFRFLNR